MAEIPALYTNPDPTNFVPHHSLLDEEQREALYDETEKIAPHMANAHLKIKTFGANGMTGNVNTRRILEIFKGVGYDGHIVLEYFGDGDPREPVSRGIDLLRRLLDAS